MLLASVRVFPAPADVGIDERRPFLLANRDRLQSLKRFRRSYADAYRCGPTRLLFSDASDDAGLRIRFAVIFEDGREMHRDSTNFVVNPDGTARLRFPDGAILELKGTLETLRIVAARGLPAEFNAWIGMSCAVDLEYERETW